MSNFRRRSYHSEDNFYRLAVALKIKRRLTRFYCILNLLDVLQVCGFTYGKAIISTGCYHGVLVSRSLLEVRLFQCRLTWCRVVCLYYTVLVDELLFSHLFHITSGCQDQGTGGCCGLTDHGLSGCRQCCRVSGVVRVVIVVWNVIGCRSDDVSGWRSPYDVVRRRGLCVDAALLLCLGHDDVLDQTIELLGGGRWQHITLRRGFRSHSRRRRGTEPPRR